MNIFYTNYNYFRKFSDYFRYLLKNLFSMSSIVSSLKDSEAKLAHKNRISLL